MNLRIPCIAIDLDSAASRVFPALGTKDWEQRLSSHYLDEKYFRAWVEGFWVCVALSDEVVEGYPFIVWIDASQEASNLSQADFERLIHVKLSAAGLDISE